MSRGMAILHGTFGRAALYELDRPMVTHVHREGHLIFHLAGPAAATVVAGEECELSGGWGAAISPWQPHDFRPGLPGTGSLLLVLYIQPPWFLEFGRDVRYAMRFGTSRIALDNGLRRLLGRLVNLLVEDDERGMLEGYLLELVSECFDRSWQWAPQRPPLPEALPCVRDFRVRNALRLMRQRLADEAGLDGIARDSGLSRAHFYKLFRQHLGITPNLYLNALRIEEALDRLVHTEDRITEIGLDLGFSTQASFTRFFVGNVGVAPTDYRRAARLAACA